MGWWFRFLPLPTLPWPHDAHMYGMTDVKSILRNPTIIFAENDAFIDRPFSTLGTIFDGKIYIFLAF